MAKDLNKVMLTGYLGADPELRYTPQGAAVCTFRVASGRSWKTADGEQHEETEWFRVVAWDKLGEICNQFLTKGTRAYVEGRLQTRKYTDQDGNERYSTEVIANDMIILSSKNGAGQQTEDEAPARPARQSPAANGNGNGRAPAAAPARPATRNAPQTIDSEEDLPF